MNQHDQASHDIAEKFGMSMFETMVKKLENRDIQIPVQDLCRALLEREEHIDPLYYAGGIPALKPVIERWDFEPAVIVKALESLEILLRRSEDYCDAARELGYVDSLKDAISVIDPASNMEALRLAKVCKKLLELPDQGDGGDGDAGEIAMTEIEEVPDLTQAQLNWLMAGKILTVINEDYKKMKLHFFLTRDRKTFVCKEPKKVKVLQDYAVKVKKIYDCFPFYDQKDSASPYVKATGFFEKKPKTIVVSQKTQSF